MEKKRENIFKNLFESHWSSSGFSTSPFLVRTNVS